jgi:tetratricopeptide (TPR) repeat protein
LDGLFIEYRDPLFGIFTIFTLIFIVSFLTYAYNIYIEKKSRKEYRKLLQKFELGDLKEDDYIHLYTTYNLPFDSILLLASSFLHKGDYNKAISVYLALLEHVKDATKKEELLELLGKTYYKGGFLQRSKDIYLKILQFSPRNIIALEYLLVIYEKLKDYPKAKDVIESLKELNINIEQEEIFISTLQIIDDSILSFEEKSLKLLDTFNNNKIIERLVVEFLLKYNKELFWKNIDKFNLSTTMDLLWYLDFNDINFNIVDNNIFLQELFSAKNHINNATISDIFEFNVLISTNNSNISVNIDLNFDFICSKCKKLHPIYDNRCPHCNSILTLKVKPQLSKGYYEKNSSLQ